MIFKAHLSCSSITFASFCTSFNAICCRLEAFWYQSENLSILDIFLSTWLNISLSSSSSEFCHVCVWWTGWQVSSCVTHRHVERHDLRTGVVPSVSLTPDTPSPNYGLYPVFHTAALTNRSPGSPSCWWVWKGLGWGRAPSFRSPSSPQSTTLHQYGGPVCLRHGRMDPDPVRHGNGPPGQGCDRWTHPAD